MNWIPENIPDGWKVTRIGEVTDVIRGGSPRPKGDPRYFGGNIPWIMIADVSKSPGKYISKTRDTVTEAGAKKSRYLKKGTLILSNSGTVCVPKVLAVDGCIHDGFVAFPDLPDELNIFYLYDFFYYIRPKIIDKHKQGVTQVNLNLDIVRNIELLLPPLNEQKRIVTKIEALQTRSTAVKEELEAIKPLLNQFRQSVLASAFRGDLTKDWREQNPDFEPAEVLLERIKQRRTDEAKTPAQQKNIKPIYSYCEENDSDKLPEGWQYFTLEKLCSSFQYGTSKKSIPEGKIPVLRMGNLQKGQIDWSDLVYTSDDSEIEKYKLKPGTVLFNRTNSPELVGKTSIYRGEQAAIFAGYLIKINNLPELDSEYLNYGLNTKQAKLYCWKVKTDGVSQSNINAKKLGKFEIPYAPLEEQKEIVRRIESLFKLADSIEYQYQQAEVDLETLNQSILAKAFRGELVPQDPNDEPASVLLERIREERDKAKPKKSKSKKKSSSKKQNQQLDIPGM